MGTAQAQPYLGHFQYVNAIEMLDAMSSGSLLIPKIGCLFRNINVLLYPVWYQSWGWQ